MKIFKITKIEKGKPKAVKDFVTEEILLSIYINGKKLLNTLCSPADLEDLVRGVLFTKGIIKKVEDIRRISINSKQWITLVELKNIKNKYTVSGGKNVSDFTIKNTTIIKLMKELQKKSKIYLKTGGTHSAALADMKTILIFREDIGRHNAIDKVIGSAIMKKMDFSNKILITSGRLPSEIVLKAYKCGIPALLSVSAPTNRGVELARVSGIILAGFVREERMNIYSGGRRVILEILKK